MYTSINMEEKYQWKKYGKNYVKKRKVLFAPKKFLRIYMPEV